MKKLLAIFCMLIVIVPSLNIVYCPIVSATQSSAKGKNVVGLDWEFIETFTDTLSDIVDDEYNPTLEIPKGRWFGSDGEIAAKNYIKNQLTNWGIDTTEDEVVSDSLLQQIHNVMHIQSNLEITDDPDQYSLTIHDTSTSTDTELDTGEFYIVPAWNFGVLDLLYSLRIGESLASSLYAIHNKEDLSGTIEINNAELYPRPIDFLNSFYYILTEYSGPILEFLKTRPGLGAILAYLIGLLEAEYGFNFEEVMLDEEAAQTDLPWYNATIGSAGSDFMFIGEDPAFNPYPAFAEPDSWFYEYFTNALRIEMVLWRAMYRDHCKGLLLYENYYNRDNETHNMEYAPYYYLPAVYIDYYTGTDLLENREDREVSIEFDQEWKSIFNIPNNGINSYNVIGEIEGTSKKETVLLSCLYDGHWSKATIDSAVGMSIVMAIAKYARNMQTEYGINPKYDLKFVAFAGEEAGLRGAYDYVRRYRDKDDYPEEQYMTIIDLNQLGYKQQWPPQTLFCIYSENESAPTLDNITKQSHYTQRTDEFTGFEIINTYTWHPYSDYTPFREREELFPSWHADTICFLQENTSKPHSGWRQHHRTNEDYTNGDSMDLYNDSFVNITAEIVWNMTRYYAYNPNSWFKNKQDFEKTVGDSNDDGKPDWVNLSFEIDTIMPHDRVTVLAQLVSTWYPFFAEKTQSYSIDRSSLSHYVNLSLGNSMPLGPYFVQLYLFNSTGEINNITNNPDKLWRGLLKYSNDTYLTTGITLTPYNAAPTVQYTPSSPQGATINAGVQTVYTTGGTDPEGDRIYYQMKYTNIDNDSIEYTGWLGPYTSGVNQSVTKTWMIPGNYTVQSRSRDNVFISNMLSNWSDPYNVTVNKGVYFIAPDKIVVNTTLNVSAIDCGMTSSTWDWKFNAGTDQTDNTTQSAEHDYNVKQAYTINLTVEDGQQTEYYFDHEIEVVSLLTNFTVSDNAVKPNETITFNSSYLGETAVDNSSWSWNFSDGNTSSSRNTTHSYNSTGTYNVTLTVKDIQNRSTNYTMKIYIDNDKPKPVSIAHMPDEFNTEDITNGFNPLKFAMGQNISIFTNAFDIGSTYASASINLLYPDGTTTNQSMTTNTSTPSTFIYVLNNTTQIGYYLYKIWITDEAGHINYSQLNFFEVDHVFGKTTPGNLNISIKNSIKGSKFTVLENGIAEYITVRLQSNESTPAKAQCMIYQNWDLIGTTEEKNISTGNISQWITFNITGTKPNLSKDTMYWLRCWSNDTCNISYDTVSNTSLVSYTCNETYDGTPPGTITIITQSPEPPDYFRNYSIYCGYSNKPIISDISHTPNSIGFGYTIAITANVTDSSGLESVTISFHYPNASYNWENETMTNVENNTYQFVFDDAWWAGQYNYTIWATDIFGNVNNSSEYNFSVSTNATISICTIYDEYQNGTLINLTDPPGPNPEVNWELIDNGETLHFWNKYDNYYINTSSGIQLTNHKDDYWTHNVLMLGYYQGGEWKKLYRTDELTGFTLDIDDDDSTHLNVTFWKNVMANGYPLRLAIRYHLGGDDNDLTVIPYIKSRAGAVPYQLAFGWELKDIQINMTTSDDYIEINGTSYDLDTTLNNTYTNLSRPIEWINETTNQTEIIGWEPRPYFYIREDIPNDKSLYLYLKWKESLNYKVQVKSRDGQANAPVTLFIKVGTLSAGQEKSTELQWYDAEESTYYFDSDDGKVTWNNNPSYLTDGSTSTFAYTSLDGDNHRCDDNSYSSGGEGTISKVQIRVHGYDSGNTVIKLRPKFGGTTYGAYYNFTPSAIDTWSSWFDITEDGSAPGTWTWSDIDSLDCDVEAEISGGLTTTYASKVEIRVTYTINYAPTVSNPFPASGSDGVVYVPWVSINVSDANDDNMNVTWLTNYSGSWTTFGTNTSVGTGTVMQNYTNATENGKWFYWKVNVSDNETYTISNVYSFYTGYQSKIVNTGSYNCTGYLFMCVEKYNSTSGNWTNVLDIYNGYPLNLTESGDNETIAFDSMFNGLLNSSILWTCGNGTYRFYVAFMNPYDEILMVPADRKLEATYEFTITFS